MNQGIIIVHNKSFFGKIISLFTKGYWQHVGFLMDDYVIEKPLRKGFLQNPIEFFLKDYTDHLIFNDLPELPMDKIVAFHGNNFHTTYDWYRTIFWPFRKYFKSGSKKWLNCVEHISQLYLFCGIMIVTDPNKNYSPDEFNEEIKKKVWLKNDRSN